MGSRWIIVARLPVSKAEMAFSFWEEDGKKIFALVPIHSDTKSVRKAIAFNSREEAQEHLDRQLEAALEVGKDLQKDLGPIEIREMVETH